MIKVYLGLGSNVGDRRVNIKSAVQFYNWDDRFQNINTSSLYETLPYGNNNQSNFLNCVITFDTKVDVYSLHKVNKELEKRIGRIVRGAWGPREIDIDLLFYGDLIIENDELSVPHPDLTNRDFVLVPLIELNEELVDPLSKKKLKSFLSQLNDKYIIDKIKFSLQ